MRTHNNIIGLIAISGKPVHRGHDMLIRKVASECDLVNVFVSTSDRKRPGEAPILGSDMEYVWREYMEAAMPDNVSLFYGGSPVGNIYGFINDEHEQGSEDYYKIYSDPVDLNSDYPPASLERYFGDFYRSGHVFLEPVQRSELIDISGTQMRKWIDEGDLKSFRSMLPEHISLDDRAVDDIWKRVRRSALNIKRPKKRTKKRSGH